MCSEYTDTEWTFGLGWVRKNELDFMEFLFASVFL